MSEYAVEKLKKMEQVLRTRGLPITHQRRLIMEVLLERTDHPTAGQVFATVHDRSPEISRRTVYRVLKTLRRWNWFVAYITLEQRPVLMRGRAGIIIYCVHGATELWTWTTSNWTTSRCPRASFTGLT